MSSFLVKSAENDGFKIEVDVLFPYVQKLTIVKVISDMTLLSGHEYCRRGSFDWGGLSKKNKNDFPRELTQSSKV